MTTREEYQARRKAWVEALRSGRYTQTVECLRDEDGFCCLGVACDVSEIGQWGQDKYGNDAYVVGESEKTTELPIAVRDWFGLTQCGGYLGETTLWRENDRAGKSFSEIADLIEQRAADLFVPEAL